MALESAKVEVRATAPGMLVTQNPIRGQAPKAYVVLAKGTQLSEGEIQTFLADKLSPIETPRLFEFRTDLPKSGAGKILKRSV